jgi:uncharacterized membrane protein YeiH
LEGFDSAQLLTRALDLVGTLAFAISGAMQGVRRGLDIFGVLMLAFVTAVSGGILRDLLIGAVPPAALASSYYLALAMGAGLLTFRFHKVFKRLNQPVQLFDAAGLGIFAVVGTQKALLYGLDWPMAVVLGMCSGIGGGMVRDMLTAQVPTVLHTDVYAVAALAGGLVVPLGAYLHLPPIGVILGGALLCVTLRLLALRHGWELPVAKKRIGAGAQSNADAPNVRGLQ